VLIKKAELAGLSRDIRRIIDGQDVDLREHTEGVLAILKNDIYALANLKNEQIEVLQQERDALKNRLADISHQLKTPLTSTMIMADLLEEAPADKQLEFITNIKTSLVRMDWLVGVLLKIAKLETGGVEFAPEPVLASELTEMALEPLRISLDINEQRVEPIGEAELHCDKRWSAEALTNVIKNALEYSPRGGTVFIECGTNPISTGIAVTDSGSGIGRSAIAQGFTRFEGSRSAHGYGIGLPLSMAIMRGQGGDIHVDGGGGASGLAGGSGVGSSGSESGGGVGDIGASGMGRGATFTLKFYH
jgi:signal transduction histidine kinase